MSRLVRRGVVCLRRCVRCCACRLRRRFLTAGGPAFPSTPSSTGDIVAAADSVGTAMAFVPDRYGPVTEVLICDTLLRRAASHDLPAMLAGRRAEIEQVIGPGDHFAIVLDQQQRVAQVAQPEQCARAAGDCRAGASRSSARRARTARRSVRCRPGWPGGCAAPRRPRASGRRGSA